MKVKRVLNGVILDVDLPQDIAHGIECGGWEQCEHDRVNRFLPDMDVIELGGGTGYISCFINKKLSPNRKHIVLESNTEWIPMIQNHAKLNNCHFDLINEAYSSTGLNLASIIKTFSIRDFVLVMDIEGAEVDLINNELSVLDSCKLAIIEFHPQFGIQVNEAYTKFIDSGFFEVERCRCASWVGVYKNVR